MNDDLQAQLKELFDQLPPPVQDAITSADVSKQLRELGNTRKLHVDQLDALENEVLMALFGLKPMVDIAKNLGQALGVSSEAAEDIASSISQIVFAPIREELERGLEHPEAKVKEVSGVENARSQILANQPVARTEEPAAALQSPTTNPAATTPNMTAGDTPPATSSPSPVPATPPAPPPTEKAVRAPTTSLYKPGEPSSTRKNVHDDPYRESPL